jgi:hypothetical protein
MRKTAWFATALVLVVLVVMTVARFVRTDLRWPILLASFSAYALVGFVVVLIGCAFVVRRSRRRLRVAVVALVAVVGLAVQGWAQAPYVVGGAGSEPGLTVMTSDLEFGRGDARPFSVRNGGLDLRVAAPVPFRVLAVHAAQPILEPKTWFRDLGRVRERASSLTEEGPTIVVGDFNATHDHAPWRAILGAGLRDAAEQAGSGWQPTWPNSYRGWVVPLIMIDHVLTTDQYAACHTRTVLISGTDHRALVVKLHVRQ